jgi:hypothetical protein
MLGNIRNIRKILEIDMCINCYQNSVQIRYKVLDMASVTSNRVYNTYRFILIKLISEFISGNVFTSVKGLTPILLLALTFFFLLQAAYHEENRHKFLSNTFMSDCVQHTVFCSGAENYRHQHHSTDLQHDLHDRTQNKCLKCEHNYRFTANCFKSFTRAKDREGPPHPVIAGTRSDIREKVISRFIA